MSLLSIETLKAEILKFSAGGHPIDHLAMNPDLWAQYLQTYPNTCKASKKEGVLGILNMGNLEFRVKARNLPYVGLNAFERSGSDEVYLVSYGSEFLIRGDF